jgi:hypothetical protein
MPYPLLPPAYKQIEDAGIDVTATPTLVFESFLSAQDGILFSSSVSLNLTVSNSILNSVSLMSDIGLSLESKHELEERIAFSLSSNLSSASVLDVVATIIFSGNVQLIQQGLLAIRSELEFGSVSSVLFQAGSYYESQLELDTISLFTVTTKLDFVSVIELAVEVDLLSVNQAALLSSLLFSDSVGMQQGSSLATAGQISFVSAANMDLYYDLLIFLSVAFAGNALFQVQNELSVEAVLRLTTVVSDYFTGIISSEQFITFAVEAGMSIEVVGRVLIFRNELVKVNLKSHVFDVNADLKMNDIETVN